MKKTIEPNEVLEEKWSETIGSIINDIELAEKVDPVKLKEMLNDLTTYADHIADFIEMNEDIPEELKNANEDINKRLKEKILNNN